MDFWDMVMIVAAAALAISIIIVWTPLRPLWHYPEKRGLNELSLFLEGLVVLTWPIAALEAWAVALLALRRPRSTVARMVRQPGILACLTVLLLLVLAAGPLVVLGTVDAYHLFTLVLLQYIPPFVGYGVVVAWILASLGRTLRRSTSWPNRAGIVVGAWWIAISLLTTLFALGLNQAWFEA
jgi:hypothetical protein